MYFPGTGVPAQRAGQISVYNNRPIMPMPVKETEPGFLKIRKRIALIANPDETRWHHHLPGICGCGLW